MITILDNLLVFDNFISETTEESSSSSSSSSSDDDKDRMSEISDSRSYSAEPSSDLGRVEVILMMYFYRTFSALVLATSELNQSGDFTIIDHETYNWFLDIYAASNNH